MIIDAIKTLATETGCDWFSIVLALKDREILTSKQVREIEEFFFSVEEQTSSKNS